MNTWRPGSAVAAEDGFTVVADAAGDVVVVALTAPQVLPRSSAGGLMYCVGCPGEPVTIWVPRGGVRLCGDCLAAAETTSVSDSPTGDEHGEQR